MKTITEIKQAIKQLPDKKRHALSRWLIEQENEAWDRQMEQDAKAGRLDFLVEEAKDALRSGKLRRLP